MITLNSYALVIWWLTFQAETEYYVFPHSYLVICLVYIMSLWKSICLLLLKQRQKDKKSSSITVVNILLNCWWFLSHHSAMPSLWSCSCTLLQIKSTLGSSPSQADQTQEQNPPVISCRVTTVLQEETDFSLTRRKKNLFLTCCLVIEMTHWYIFFSYMILTITAHYLWPVLSTVHSA